MRFKEGQRVVRITLGGIWKGNKGNTDNYGPKYKEVVTVDGYLKKCYVMFKEYPRIDEGERNGYNDKHFAPVINDLISTEELEEALNSEPVESQVNQTI